MNNGRYLCRLQTPNGKTLFAMVKVDKEYLGGGTVEIPVLLSTDTKDLSRSSVKGFVWMTRHNGQQIGSPINMRAMDKMWTSLGVDTEQLFQEDIQLFTSSSVIGEVNLELCLERRDVVDDEWRERNPENADGDPVEPRFKLSDSASAHGFSEYLQQKTGLILTPLESSIFLKSDKPITVK